MTAQEIITASLRLIGASAQGETPPADEMQEGLSALNTMLDSWSSWRLTIAVLTSENFPLVSGTASYTIGSGGDWDTVRPLRIENAYVRSLGLDYPVKKISQIDYNSIVEKDIGGRPEFLWYNNQRPLGIVSLYHTPNAADTLFIDTWKPLTAIAGLTIEIDFPEGYDEAIKYNLAIRMSPEYGVTASPDVRDIAKTSLNVIKSFNKPKAESSLGIPTMDSNGYGNIESGDVN